MVLSHRERWIAIATVATLLVLALDRAVLAPIQARRTAVEMETRRILGELADARVVFARKRSLMPVWREMLDSGLASGVPAAESAVLHAVRNWSQEAGFALVSLRPEKVADQGAMKEVTFQASGVGSMEAVTGFLYRLETSRIPLRITELQIGSRREGTDDLSLQLRMSSLCREVEPVAPATPAGMAAPAIESSGDGL